MEREVLFCLTALQMGLASPEQLRSIGKDLREKKIGSLRAELIKRALITPENVKNIEHAVDITASFHNGNYKKILSLNIYRKLVKEAFGDSISISQEGDIRPSYSKTGVGDEESNLHVVTEESPGRYVVLREIGSGGIGRVILAFDRHTGRNIAIKELLPEIVTHSPQDTAMMPLLARFLREARLTAQLEHPSIVPIYEIGKRENNLIYYTMKYVKGRTLSELLRECGSLSERLRYLTHFINLCNAIAYAHSKGVIHRDIKPHNVMIGEFGETVVLDWGLAKIKGLDKGENEKFINKMRLLKDDAAGRTIAGEVIGTPQYMPPEQAWGDINNIDEKSDIYSLGAVLYEILTGFPPFDGNSPIDIVKEVRAYSRGERRLKPIKLEEPECPDELAAIAEKALSADKQNRYSSVVDLIDDVEAYMAGEKVSGHKYSFFSHIKYIFKRGKRSITYLLIVAIIIALSIYSILHINNIKTWTRHRLYLQRMVDQLINKDYILASYYSFIAQSTHRNSLDLSNIQFNPLTTSIINAISLKNEIITTLSVSKDSKYLVVGTENGTIYLFELPSLRVMGKKSFSSGVTKVKFLGEGERFAIGFHDGSLRIFNVNPFSLVKTAKDFTTPVRAIVLSFGGKYLFTAAGSLSKDERQCNDCSIMIYSSESYKFLDRLSGHSLAISNLYFTETGSYLISSSFDGNIIFWDVFAKREHKRYSLPTAVLDFYVDNNNSLAAITEDGKISLFSATGSIVNVFYKSYNHHLIEKIGDMIISGGGAYNNDQCRFCDIKVYDENQNLNIIQEFKFRITDFESTRDSKYIVVADEKGNIYVLDFKIIKAKPFRTTYKHLLYDEPKALRCLKNENVCLATDRAGYITILSKNKVESEVKARNLANYNIKSVHIIDKENFIVNTLEDEVYHINIRNPEGVKILNENIKIKSLKISSNNEYIGIIDTDENFYLLKRVGGKIIDTQYREKNISTFAFSLDSLLMYFLKAEFNIANKRYYILTQKEVLTDEPEKIILKTPNEFYDIMAFNNPLILGQHNDVFSISESKLLRTYKLDAPFKIKKLIHLPQSALLLTLFEEKNILAIYDISKGRLVSYLIGHSEQVVEADVLDNRIFTVGKDGTIIVYDVRVEPYVQTYAIPNIQQEVKRLRLLMEKLNKFYEE
ncbi:MAG: protein kinase [Deltaproteobacteria bacterium]|nr:protein kinase [Deltaproteobacteria bacterium]